MEKKIVALAVTIPQNTPEKEIRAEMEDAFKNGLELNHKIGSRKPKHKPNFIWLVYRGKVRVIGFLDRYEYKSFKCETTGTEWPKSWYAVFHSAVFVEGTEMKGFQGIRYIRVGE